MTSEFTIGLHVLGFLTARGGQPLTSELLARTYGTSPVVLRRVLSKLRKAGLIATRRGVGGGSVLARPASEISLLDAYSALTDSPVLLPRHPGEHAGPAKVLAAYINGIYADAEAALLQRLASVSVEQMDEEVRPAICEAMNSWASSHTGAA